MKRIVATSVPRRIGQLAGVLILAGWLVALLAGLNPAPLLTWERAGRKPAAEEDLAQRPGEPAMGGPVAGRFVLADGSIAYAWGRFRLSPDYFISVWHGGPLREVGSQGLGFPTHLFASDGDEIYYATEQARVGAVDATAQRPWEWAHDQTPTALTAVPHDGVLLGDQRGRVVRVGTDGQIRWKRQVWKVPVTGIGVLPDGVAIWDRTGEVLVLDGDGVSRWSGRGFPAGARVVANPGRGEFLVRDSRGDAWRVRAATRIGSQRALGTWTVTPIGWTTLALGLALLLAPLVAWRTVAIAMWRHRHVYAMLLPSLALLAMFEYGPALTALGQSLYDFNLTGTARFTGLGNFLRLGDDPYFWTGLGNMGLITLGGVAKLALPLLAAELVFWLARESWRQVYRTLFLLPGVVPGLVTILIWKMIYDPSIGTANELLRAFGLSRWEHAWLAEPSTALAAVIFMGFPWVGLTAFLVFLGGLLHIPASVFESATLDGAGAWARFRRIDFPLLVPQLRLLLVLTVVGSVQEFASVLVMTRGGPGIATYTPALHMFLETTEGARVGYASAIGIVLFLLAVGGSWLINRSFTRWDYRA
ncbi:MAG TPA: sugar ABC transporter permease [Opitutaceae bacterium]|nr:sugar ABC transporter permease [Opitutaceae bacterium]HND60875.1 sugar ABC transporter permease [Opitutaceae bacterium]